VAQPVAVTNTSPIIALVGVGELRVLGALFASIVVPFEVWQELVDKPGAPEPALLRALPGVAFQPTPPWPPEAAALDPGERAAIALAVAIPDAWVLLDDIAARRVATDLGIPVRGTLGVLVEGKRRGLLPGVRPLVEQMIENGCRLAPQLVSSVLAAVGEE
jgi:predicted nucleic acid-binding protein